MMGPRQVTQRALFYEFSLENHVPPRHILRQIDRFVDLTSVRAHLAPYYSAIGRPSIDPELMIRMLLIGYVMGIRSERRLCEEVHLNLAYRWFCRLDLTDPVPDHSSFSKNRHGRFRESDLLRHLFETVVARCIGEGLVGGSIFAADASLIRADANKQNSTARDEWDVSAIDPKDAPRAVREYLDVLDEAAFGAASEVDPKFTSHSDPASQWTGALKGPAFFAYADNYLIDTDNGIIVDVEASRAIRQAEVGATRTMIERTRDRFELYPEILTADKAYGSAENLNWLISDEGILPHIPVFDNSNRRAGVLPSSAFAFDHEADEYTCPNGKKVKNTGARCASREAGSARMDLSGTTQGRLTARHARSSPNASPTNRPEKSRGTYTKAPAIWLANSPNPMPTSIASADERRSRCSSPISNAS